MRYILAIVSIVLTCCSTSVESQEAEKNLAPLSKPSTFLVRPIPTESGNQDIGFDILPVSDGALISGSTAVGGGPPDGLLLRVTGEGDVIWRKVYGEKGLDLIFSALPDGEGGFVCVGFKSPDGGMGMKAMDGWILRIDNDGQIIWEHTYGGSGEDRLTGIRATSNGWIAVGHKEMPDTGIHAWVLRIDRNGKELSSWTYDGSEPTKGLDVLPLPDGGCIVVGGIGAQRESSDGFVVRVKADGTKQWNHPITGPGMQVGYHIQAFKDDSFLVIGYGYINEAQNFDAYVLRINSTGKIIYHHTLGDTSNDRATNAMIFENNSFMVVGLTQRPGSNNEDVGWDLVLYAVDPKGIALWSGRYGGDGVEFGRAVKGDADNLWIIGHTTTNRTGSSVLLIRMDASFLLK